MSNMHPGTSAFRNVPRTGVIYVMTQAAAHGYRGSNADWCNLGQGQPEAGELPGAPPRITHIDVAPEDNEYAPVPGLLELRQAVADLYNRTYRVGKVSQYTAKNVAISGGGRTGLTRVVAALGHINLGHFLPDYTAYEELLDIFRSFNPIPILLDGARGYAFTQEELRREVMGRGLGALLLSNPCNPTGKVIYGDELQGWVDICRELGTALIVDEFYSRYIWNGEGPVSAAAHVDDVDHDPVLIIDGLTKNWRYPGWRVSWTVGPQSLIDGIASAGSFLDGGASRPLQRAALALFSDDIVNAETATIQSVFGAKRRLLMERLTSMGITMDVEPNGSFYVWGNLSNLPPTLRDGRAFFEEALKHRVIVVPGEFFDVNPGHRRPGAASRFKNYARFSFGPEHASLEAGMARLERMIANAR